MAFSLVRNERLYLQKNASTYGLVPNAAGAATVANANCCRVIEFQANNTIATIIRRDKTGTRSLTTGTKGREFATWSTRMSLAGNGAAGTVPDCDPILAALFGINATLVASTSVTYNLNDAIPDFVPWSFRTPSTIQQRCVLGAVVEEGQFRLGQDIAEWTARGRALFALDQDYFASATTAEKGGLTAFPAEPSAPVTNGSPVIGFTGSVTMDGNAMAEIKNATIVVKTLNDLVLDTFGNYNASGSEGDTREVTIQFELDDSDSTGVKNLKAKAKAKTPMTFTLVLGTVTGNIWTFTLRNVQLDDAQYNEGQRRYRAGFSGRAWATTLSGLDECTLAIT